MVDLTGTFALLLLFFSGKTAASQEESEVTFQLGELGEITGVVRYAKTYPAAPYSNRTLYSFRNLPYANSVAGENRFRQSTLRNTSLSTTGPYDATRHGPLCIQGGLGTEDLEAVNNLTLSALLDSLNLGSIPPNLILTVLGDMLGAPPGLLKPESRLGDVLHAWLDIDLSMAEDCLHLAVTTPWRPDGSEPATADLHPVMFFVHGGAFYAGTQIRMGADRLAAWDNVVVVAINYRVGPLGFMCLDTEEAAGNMGMLDMVVALEWVHLHIRRFGGDPTRITVFGESAGSASIGHLLLSDATNGLFAAGIGQSGSAIAPWAFDLTPEHHARGIAAGVGCDQAAQDDLVDCLRKVSAKEISQAFGAYRLEQRAEGGLGFGGSIPCAQTKGARKFYTADQTPEKILFEGKYEKVPIMFGANSYEGSYVYGVVYNDFLVANNYTEDEEFLRHEFLPYLLRAIGVTNSYAMESTLRREYFDEWQLGNLTAMQAGAIDLLSVFFIKASAYKMVEENSKHLANASFWYAFNYEATMKSAFHLLFVDPAKKAQMARPGTSHADELMYLFDVELPLLLCDLGQFQAELTACFPNCLLSPESEFRMKWSHCLTGRLTDEELAVSAVLAQTWTSFATTGHPGHGAQAWTRDHPYYLSITTDVALKEDYTLEYHIAKEEAYPSATTPTEPPTNGTTAAQASTTEPPTTSPTAGSTTQGSGSTTGSNDSPTVRPVLSIIFFAIIATLLH